MNNDALTKIYGRGWKFPPTFSPKVGVEMVSGLEDIQESLRILFSTELGERIMRQDYGCDLQNYVFQNISEELISQIVTTISESILRYEPRIDVDSITATQNSQQANYLDLTVIYRLTGSNINQQLHGLIDIGDGRGVRFI